jgi:hypothetical protein
MDNILYEAPVPRSEGKPGRGFIIPTPQPTETDSLHPWTPARPAYPP